MRALLLASRFLCQPLAPPLCILTTPPPPSSTLFPYTTLFRSVKIRTPQLMLISEARGMSPALVTSRELRRDRKSTRLNSSHANISYAVFCLKKKSKMVGGGLPVGAYSGGAYVLKKVMLAGQAF